MFEDIHTYASARASTIKRPSSQSSYFMNPVDRAIQNARSRKRGRNSAIGPPVLFRLLLTRAKSPGRMSPPGVVRFWNRVLGRGNGTGPAAPSRAPSPGRRSRPGRFRGTGLAGCFFSKSLRDSERVPAEDTPAGETRRGGACSNDVENRGSPPAGSRNGGSRVSGCRNPLLPDASPSGRRR